MTGPPRRHPSPAAQRRSEAQWRARIGLTALFLLVLLAAALIVWLVRSAGGGLIPPLPRLTSTGRR
jgi:hypothetical protein